MNESHTGMRSPRYYAQVLKRRAWIVVLMATVGVGLGVLYSHHQHRLYKANADIVVNTGALLNSSGASGRSDAARFVATEAAIASSPAVAQKGLENATAVDPSLSSWTPQALITHSTVVADPDSNIVHFSVQAAQKDAAMALANGYAEAAASSNIDVALTQIQHQLDPLNAQLKTITADILNTQQQINAAQANHEGTSAYDAHMRDLSTQQGVLLKQQQGLVSQKHLLESTTAEGTSTVSSIAAKATGAAQIQPTTTRNIAAGLIVGLMLGLGLAFLREAMDGRIRSAEDVTDELGLPILARIPEPPRKLRSQEELALLVDDGGVHSEAYRKLRVGFDLANLGTNATLVMVTSSVDQEGKTTTIANLAVALAQVGRRVVVIDMDLRRPQLNRYFGLEQFPGVTDVAVGGVPLDEALRSVALTKQPGKSAKRSTNGNGSHASVSGVLDVLPVGRPVPDPSAFIEGPAFHELLEQLKEQFDVVLIDTTPTLPVSDARALMRKVDAVLPVARLGTVNRHMLREFRRELAGTQVPVLGVIVTAADADDAYSYAYGYGYGYAGGAAAGAGSVTPAEAAPTDAR